MNTKTQRLYFLMLLIAIASALAFFVFRPFLVLLVLAAVFAVVLQPLYRWVLCLMNRSPGLAAFATMLVAAVCILAPLTFIAVQVVGDARHLYVSLSAGGETYVNTVLQYADGTAARYAPNLDLSSAALSVSIDEYIKNGLAWLVQHVGGALGSLVQLLASFFVFLIALYYLLRDGAKLKRVLIEESPLKDADDTLVLTRLESAVNSIMRGSLTIALVQGILTSIGFALFGVPNSVLWGVVAAFAALIPGIGTSLVLAPGIAYLFIVGATAPGVGLLIWGIIAVGLIDNLLGPKLVGKGMHMHPLLVLLSVFGGLAFFGPAGVFLGPLCTSLLFALLSIYPHLSRQTSVAAV